MNEFDEFMTALENSEILTGWANFMAKKQQEKETTTDCKANKEE